MMKKRFAARKKFVRKSRYASALTSPYVRGPELKNVDIVSSVVPISTSGSVVNLNSIAPGSEVYQRVGRQVSLRGLEFKAYFQLTGQVGTNDFIRAALIYDRQPDGATIVFDDVFTSLTNVGVSNVESAAFPNVGNNERFKVLKDWNLPLVMVSSATLSVPLAAMDQNLPLFMHKYLSLRGLETRFAQGSTTPQSGGLFLVTKGSFAVGTQPYNLIFTSRVTYTDV